MAVDAERLQLILEVQGNRFEQQLKKQNATAYRLFKSLEDRASQMEKGVGASFGSLGKRLAGLFAGITVGRALGDIQRAAESYQKVVNSLKVAGVSDAELPKTLDAVYQSAIKNAVPMEALAQLFGRVSQAQTTLGTTSGELLKFTDLVAQGLRVSGTSASEASGSLLQLSQALSGGKVQAEEYNSLLDGQYPLLQAVAAGMKEAGGDVAKLTQLVKAGEVSSKAFYDAARAGGDVRQIALLDRIYAPAGRLLFLESR
ncbi:hypothetical protein ASE63_06725 [Bosea sp. Root381]|nr:hypothetical protein ASE63_06725 [Bosea sp. Root381]